MVKKRLFIVHVLDEILEVVCNADLLVHEIDGYILPCIAERDLRRFANLRSTSSELGLNLPLHEVLLTLLTKPDQYLIIPC